MLTDGLWVTLTSPVYFNHWDAYSNQDMALILCEHVQVFTIHYYHNDVLLFLVMLSTHWITIFLQVEVGDDYKVSALHADLISRSVATQRLGVNLDENWSEILQVGQEIKNRMHDK